MVTFQFYQIHELEFYNHNLQVHQYFLLFLILFYSLLNLLLHLYIYTLLFYLYNNSLNILLIPVQFEDYFLIHQHILLVLMKLEILKLVNLHQGHLQFSAGYKFVLNHLYLLLLSYIVK